MKVSLNLAQHYSNVDLKSIPKDKLIKRIGAQLGAIEEVIDWAPKYKDVVVVKVVSCEDHPNADRLHVCMIDDGRKARGVKRDNKGLVQVVCGAPNVRAGMFVAWIPPGATVPSTFGTPDPFILDARELRGVVSNGMLASSKELGISDDHDGILEILAEEVGHTPKPGEPLTNHFGLDDLVVDCENKMFTHRPDCFGNLGVARELAGISGLGFKSPDWYTRLPKFAAKSALKLQIENDVSKLVPRFLAVAMSEVTVSASPIWLQASLARVGIKPINNIVDITNYVMHLTGQPLHAFDYDKLASTQLGPRMAHKGEKLALLNGKEITLDENDIVIATDKKAVALAGVMGGSETEVDESTKNIVIEAATFDMYAIRRTCMRHGLFTDAATRYTKGQSPLQNGRALLYALKNLSKIAGGQQASSVQDIHGKLVEPAPVTITAQFINERLGTKLSLKDIAKLLENVEFTIKSVPADKNRLHVMPPFWRTDIEMPEDLVEEVGRLHGFDSLPLQLPPGTSSPSTRNKSLDRNQTLRQTLKAAGANEVLTYSFVHGDLIEKAGQDMDQAFHLRNALSPDLQYYRLSLTPSLLDKVNANIRGDIVRSDDNEFAIFEIGKVHSNTEIDEKGIPREFDRLSFVFAADEKTAARKYNGAPYFMARKYLESTLDGSVFGLRPLSEAKAGEHQLLAQMLAPFEPSRAAVVSDRDRIVGVVGEFTANVKKSFKLPEFSAGFELFLSSLHVGATNDYVVISSFPKTQQDITLEVTTETVVADIVKALNEDLLAAEAEHGYESTAQVRDIFKQKDSDKKRVTLRIWLSHSARTLTTAETNKLLDSIADNLKTKLSAERI